MSLIKFIFAASNAGSVNNSPPPSGNPVENLQASQGTNQALLTWDSYSGAVDYEVQKSSFSSSRGFGTIEFNQATTSLTDNVGVETTYYRVRANLSGGGTSDWSSVNTFNLNAYDPNVLSGLQLWIDGMDRSSFGYGTDFSLNHITNKASGATKHFAPISGIDAPMSFPVNGGILGTNHSMEIPNSAGDFNFLHNGSEFTFIAIFKDLETVASRTGTIFSTNDGLSANIGMWYGTQDQTTDRDFKCLVTNSGVRGINSTLPDSFVDGNFNVHMARYNGSSTLDVVANQSALGTTSSVPANFTSSDSTNNFKLFYGTSVNKFNGILCQLAIWDRELTPSEYAAATTGLLERARVSSGSIDVSNAWPINTLPTGHFLNVGIGQSNNGTASSVGSLIPDDGDAYRHNRFLAENFMFEKLVGINETNDYGPFVPLGKILQDTDNNIRMVHKKVWVQGSGTSEESRGGKPSGDHFGTGGTYRTDQVTDEDEVKNDLGVIEPKFYIQTGWENEAWAIEGGTLPSENYSGTLTEKKAESKANQLAYLDWINSRHPSALIGLVYVSYDSADSFPGSQGFQTEREILTEIAADTTRPWVVTAQDDTLRIAQDNEVEVDDIHWVTNPAHERNAAVLATWIVNNFT